MLTSEAATQRFPRRGLHIRDQAAARDDREPQEERSDCVQPGRRGRRPVRIPAFGATEDADVKGDGIGERDQDQRDLRDERGIVEEVGGVRREHYESRRHDYDERPRRPRQEMTRQRPHRHAARESEHAQIEHDDRAHQDHEA